MRHFVDLQAATLDQDDVGEPIKTWKTTVAAIPCAVEATSGGEVRRGRQMDATATDLVRMRHPQGAFVVTPLDRLWFEGRALNVVRAYDPDGRRADLFIECAEDGQQAASAQA